MAKEASTKQRLKLALAKLKRDADRDGTRGPSISAVAREVGVSHTLIHTKYPDIADEIRDANGRGPKQLLEKQRTAARNAEDRAMELRAELAALKAQNRGLASDNARLILIVKGLEHRVAVLESTSASLRPSTASRSTRL